MHRFADSQVGGGEKFLLLPPLLRDIGVHWSRSPGPEGGPAIINENN